MRDHDTHPATGWPALKAHIEANPIEGEPPEVRRRFDALAPPGPEGEADCLGGVPGRWFGDAGAPPALWLHGGGLVFGSPRSHASMADVVARKAGRRVFVADYRLAPEAPWPAQRDDALALLDALPPGIPAIGDSAGGFVALHAALARPGRVGALALISPNTDHTDRSRTREVNGDRDAMNDPEQDRALARQAFGVNPSTHPDASLLAADLSPLPPVWLTACSHEVLLDDTLLLAGALSVAGVAATVRIEPGLCHLWPLWPAALPEARATLEALARFVARV